MNRKALKLGILFIICIGIPSLILTLFTIRSIKSEYLFIEKRIQESYLNEIRLTQEQIKDHLDQIQYNIFTSDKSGDWLGYQGQKFEVIPGELILYPEETSADKTDSETDFLKNNGDFLMDFESVPVYQDVVELYFQQENDPAVNQMVNDLAYQQTKMEFTKNAELKEEVYQQAQESGSIISQRNINIMPETDIIDLESASVFVFKPMTFSQIINNIEKDHGIIPRIIHDSLQLLYWQIEPDGIINGCLIDETEFRDSLFDLLPGIINEQRIITILDEKGNPLFMPENSNTDWKVPIVSKEISELLPGWEIAVYLSDPDRIDAETRWITMSMWALLIVLILFIAAGSLFIFMMIMAEVKTAMQKTTFVANVSHELKTPLTSIKMFSELLQDRKITNPGKQKQYLKIIINETDRLSRLINNVLSFSRIERNIVKYNKSVIELARLVRQYMESNIPELESRGFSVSLEIPEYPVYIFADPESIIQIHLNLVSNSVKYSDSVKQISVSLKAENYKAVLTVTDRGIGINEKCASRIFRRFYRADSRLSAKTQGTGLGLTISSHLAKAHGGSINYKPNPQGGSIFTLIIPLYMENENEQKDNINSRR